MSHKIIYMGVINGKNEYRAIMSQLPEYPKLDQLITAIVNAPKIENTEDVEDALSMHKGYFECIELIVGKFYDLPKGYEFEKTLSRNEWSGKTVRYVNIKRKL